LGKIGERVEGALYWQEKEGRRGGNSVNHYFKLSSQREEGKIRRGKMVDPREQEKSMRGRGMIPKRMESTIF